jgi:hypothetical protein
MNNSRLRCTIIDAMQQVLGNDSYINSPNISKLKDGTRVYRIIGSCPYYEGSLFKRDGKIWVRDKANEPAKVIPDDGEHDDLPHYRKWEWRLLHRGPEVIEQELREALQQRGQPNIEVQQRLYDIDRIQAHWQRQ